MKNPLLSIKSIGFKRFKKAGKLAETNRNPEINKIKRKNKKKFFARLDAIKLGRPQNLLVFETTGFTLYGALIRSGLSASATPEAMGSSKAVDFSTAIAEVLEQLRTKSKKKLPKTAVLITPSAASGLLFLPVDPEKPQPRAQMGELVRWEIEPMFARQNGIWFIGALLMGRGYITAGQRREIAAGAGPNVRFGAEACQLGYASQEQVDECLNLQENLALFDDDVNSDWVPQTGTEEEGEDGMFTWYGIGFGEAMRKQWVKAFQQHALSLDWIYPQIGLALASIPGSEREWMLVDVRQEQFAVLRGKAGQLSSMRVESLQDGQLDGDSITELCREEIRPDIQDVYLCSDEKAYKPLAAQLSQTLRREIARFSLPEMAADVKTMPKQVLLSVIGAASHALGHTSVNSLPRVIARPPLPPLWKRRELYAPVALVLLVITIICFDVSMRYRTWQNELALAQLDAEYEQKMHIKKQVESTTGEVTAMQREIAAKQTLLAQLEQRKHLLKDVILNRVTLVPGLLRAVSSAMGSEVLIDSIEEEKDRTSFLLTGVALSDTKGQLFVNRLNANLKPWKYKVADVKFHLGRGRREISGYTLEILLTPIKPLPEDRG